MIESNHVIYSNGELRLKKEQDPFEAPQDDSSHRAPCIGNAALISHASSMVWTTRRGGGGGRMPGLTNLGREGGKEGQEARNANEGAG